MSAVATCRGDLGVEEHLDRVLASLTAVPHTTVSVAVGLGLVLARHVHAPTDLPAFDNSAMDGFAVCSVDVVTDTPMPVGAEIAAGESRPAALKPGTAVPIMTGAPLPSGADCVVPIELSVPGPEGVSFSARPTPGDHVRRCGEERGVGDRLAIAGSTLSPVLAGALAASGVDTVAVHRRPRVAVLSTGSELTAPGARLKPGHVHDANSTLLAALMEQAGATVTALRPCADKPAKLRRILESAAGDHDLLVTAGGISRGSHEVVRQALADDVGFVRVAMTPGSPQGLGCVLGTPMLALPGNPAAALVSWCLFARPAVRALSGMTEPVAGWLPVQTVDAGADVKQTRLWPAVLDRREGEVVATPCGSAHQLSSYVRCDAVVHQAPNRPAQALTLG